jgi:hypothetical protein
MGLFVAWLAWTFMTPRMTCAQLPGGGPCNVTPACLPYALFGTLIGVSLTGVGVLLAVRSLDE